MQSAAESGSLVFFEPSAVEDDDLFDRAIDLCSIVKYSSDRLSDRISARRLKAGTIAIVSHGADGLEVGTLAYMAPEQTGRMNRSIDSRSDLYALGVMFYQMLTGRLPFSATDPMEWVHCHIARKPAAPAERLESVPAPISEILMKLLAKTAEDRYQTAAGVEHDLRRCLAEWERHGPIEPLRSANATGPIGS